MTYTAIIPTLTTPRLTLREPRISDVPTVADFFASDRCKWIGGPWPRSDAWFAVLESIGHWAVHGFGLWSVDCRDTGTFIGRVGVLKHEGWAEPELAWHVFDGAEGQGYAHEAALAVRTHAHDAIGLGPLISFIDPANIRSKALAEHLGATFEREADKNGYPLHIYRHPPEGTQP